MKHPCSSPGDVSGSLYFLRDKTVQAEAPSTFCTLHTVTEDCMRIAGVADLNTFIGSQASAECTQYSPQALKSKSMPKGCHSCAKTLTAPLIVTTFPTMFQHVAHIMPVLWSGRHPTGKACTNRCIAHCSRQRNRCAEGTCCECANLEQNTELWYTSKMLRLSTLVDAQWCWDIL
jgi:hypothetical protein